MQRNNYNFQAFEDCYSSVKLYGMQLKAPVTSGLTVYRTLWQVPVPHMWVIIPQLRCSNGPSLFSYKTRHKRPHTRTHTHIYTQMSEQTPVDF